MAKVIKGLASIKANKQEQQERAQAANRPKADWLSSVFGVDKAGNPKRLGTTIEVLFLQELDSDVEVPDYKKARGVGFIATEHTAPGPDGYKRRALCSIDDGACYACERHKMDYKAGWKQKQNLYINVLVNVGTADKPELKTFILTRNGNSSFVDSLIQEAVDEDSITDAMYRITVSGSGTQTNWNLKRLPKAPLLDDSDVEVWDLDETAVREVAYEKQPEYYGAVADEDVVSETQPRSSYTPAASNADDEW